MNIYLKKQDLISFDCISEKMLDRLGITQDIISIDELLGKLEDLYFEKEHLEEEIEYMKQDTEDNREVFDYSEWKANQE